MQTLAARLPSPLLALLALPSYSDVPDNLRVNVQGFRGLAIDGFDPVAYHVDRRPRQGRADLALTLGGAPWRFASETYRQRFMYAPGKYLPAYGGHCARGVSKGKLLNVDPAAFAIVRGKLHLFHDFASRAAFLDDVAVNAENANANWEAMLRALPSRS